MNKRGFLSIIGIIILVIVIIVGYIGITIYQAYSVVDVVIKEKPMIESDLDELIAGNCSAITMIEIRIDRIKEKADKACNNFLIKKFVEKSEGIIINCDNKEELYGTFEERLAQQRGMCEVVSDVLEENNISIEDLKNSSA